MLHIACGICLLSHIHKILHMKKQLLTLVATVAMTSVFAQNQLMLPDTVVGTDIYLTIQQGTKQFYPGQITQTMGVNGDILAPTIILNRHQDVTMHVTNNLSDTTTIHWHGMHVAPENDGGPHIIILPGQTWRPSFKVRDHAATMWYHPHLHYKTYDHVQMGIAGFIIIRDSVEAALNLPRTYGVDDIPLAVQSKGIGANNQIITEHTALDTALMVNGTLKPFVNVPSQMVRLRLLNGAPERVFNFGFSDNRSFQAIGVDGGLLAAPVSLTRLLLSPGERAEIIINLSADSGQTIFLMNYGTQIPNAHYGAAQPGMGPGQIIPGYTSNPLNGANFNILELRVGAKTQNAITTIPSSLVSQTPIPETQADLTRNLTFMSMTAGPGGINGPFVINNAHFDMDVINFRVPFENIEIWELRNQTPIAHPFHIHNVPFYILTINGNQPPAHQRGRKDVVLVPGGNGVVRFITQFTNFYNDTLPYMYHCHMLSHEDDGMMGQFVVSSPCSASITQPQNQTASEGSIATFSVEMNDTVGVTYQWQTNTGTGFQNLENIGQYSGVFTSNLNISNVAAINNNQAFRCIVTHPCSTFTSTSATLTVNPNTGIAGVSNTHKVRIYPQPANSVLNLDFSGSILAVQSLEIMRMDGRLIQQYQPSTTLNISSLPNGIYLLKVSFDSQPATYHRFIKN
jgi:blue copper oxidase